MNANEFTANDWQKLAESLSSSAGTVTGEHPATELIYLYGQGELPPSEKDKLTPHLELCSSCNEELTQVGLFQEGQADLRAGRIQALPREQVRTRLEGLLERNRPLWDRFQRWLYSFVIVNWTDVMAGADWQDELLVRLSEGAEERLVLHYKAFDNSVFECYLFANQEKWAGQQKALKFVAESRPGWSWEKPVIFDEDDDDEADGMKVSALLRILPEEMADWPPDAKPVSVA